MSNTETAPEERICHNRDRAEGQLSPGITVADSGVQLLEPRNVPLGGPRAMTVRRTLPQRARSLVGAWCFLDFYGPDDVAESGGMKVARHPHTGLATVSWLFSGRVDHIDSAGNWATVRPGDAVFMNAGRGISHSEFSTADTTILHGAQLWYAFPDEHRFVEPSLDAHRPEPVRGPGWQARVFLGELLGSQSAVKTYAPLSGAELRLEPGAVMDIEVPAHHEHALLPVSGQVRFQGENIPDNNLAVVDTGPTTLRVEAGNEPVLALLIGGEPLGEQIVMWWNFVGRSHDDIVKYRATYQAEMGFEPVPDGSPARHFVQPDAGADQLSGDQRDDLLNTRYDDGRPFPQFGDFPPGQPGPLPAPALPTARLRPRE